jgi:hypothetical protein
LILLHHAQDRSGAKQEAISGGRGVPKLSLKGGMDFA